MRKCVSKLWSLKLRNTIEEKKLYVNIKENKEKKTYDEREYSKIEDR